MLARQIGNYKILRELGRGGMATVFEAEKDSRRFALKLLQNPSPELQLRFEREIRTLISLPHHPHLLQIFETGQSELGPYIVMELAQGGSLAERIRRQGPIHSHELQKILLAIAKALRAIHNQGLIHRDLKCANILFDSQGQAKLSDFGIARLAGDQRLTLTGAALGTPYAMAPEQISGETISPAADLWALGVLSFECLTGAPPFSGSGAALTRAIHFDNPKPLPSSVPPSISNLTIALLSKSASKRPSLDEVITRLQTKSPSRQASALKSPRLLSALGALLLLSILLFSLRKSFESPAIITVLKFPDALPDWTDALLVRQAFLDIAPELEPAFPQEILKSSQDLLAELDQQLDALPTNQQSLLQEQWRRNPKTPINTLRERLTEPQNASRKAILQDYQQLANNEATDQRSQKNLRFIKLAIAFHQKDSKLALEIFDSIELGSPNTLFDLQTLKSKIQSLHAQNLEDLAFASLQNTDYFNPWRALREFSKSPDFTSWNQRIEKLLHDTTAEQAAKAWLAWKDLAARELALSLPLAPAAVFEKITDITPDTHSISISKQLISSLLRFLANPVLLNYAKIATIFDNCEAHLPKLKPDEQAEVIDVLILTARSGFRFGGRAIFHTIFNGPVYQARLASARSELEKQLYHSFHAQGLTIDLIDGKLSQSDSIKAFQLILEGADFLEKHPDLNQVQARIRSAAVDILRILSGKLGPAARLALWKNLGFNSAEALFLWLCQQIDLCSKLQHDAIDLLLNAAFVLLENSIAPLLSEETLPTVRSRSLSMLTDLRASLDRRVRWGDLEAHTASNGRFLPIVPLYDGKQYLAEARLALVHQVSILVSNNQPELAREIINEARIRLDLEGKIRLDHWIPTIQSFEKIIDPKSSSNEINAASEHILRILRNYRQNRLKEQSPTPDLERVIIRSLKRFLNHYNFNED